jgi:predicted peptidase
MIKKIFGLILIFAGLAVKAQDLSLYEKHVYTSGKDSLPYRLLLPENYDKTKKYPLIFFLHGAGERGNDNEKQLVHGAKLFLKPENRKQYPAIVVFPQCPSDSYWSNVKFVMDTITKQRVFNFQAESEPTVAMNLAQQLLHKLITEYPVVSEKIYVGGLSMGGMGTFEIANRNPGLFAAGFPICGGGHPSFAGNFEKMSWWVFHGAKDNVVPPEYSAVMVEAMQKAGIEVKHTVYPEANHNSWDPAFAEPTLLSWLFSQSK